VIGPGRVLEHEEGEIAGEGGHGEVPFRDLPDGEVLLDDDGRHRLGLGRIDRRRPGVFPLGDVGDPLPAVRVRIDQVCARLRRDRRRLRRELLEDHLDGAIPGVLLESAMRRAES